MFHNSIDFPPVPSHSKSPVLIGLDLELFWPDQYEPLTTDNYGGKIFAIDRNPQIATNVFFSKSDWLKVGDLELIY